jgi:transposase-like protein
MSGDSFVRRYSIVADTRRRWSDEEKEAIVAEAAFPDQRFGCRAEARDQAESVVPLPAKGRSGRTIPAK